MIAAGLLAGAALLAGLADGLGILDPAYQDPGPVAATVIAVIDGDTISIKPVTWLDKKSYRRVRFETASAPEIGDQAKCDHEAQLGQQAKTFLAGVLRPGDTVYLFNGRPGRYPHRLIAKVRSSGGSTFAHSLIHAGLAVPYSPRGRPSWCPAS